MPELRKIQQAFKELLLVPPQVATPEALWGIQKDRLSIYRSLLSGTVSACLSGIYPHTRAFFKAQGIDWEPLVECYRRAYPNPSYMLLYAVEHWPAFLAEQEFSKQWPWLADVAMYEWQEALVQNLPDTPLPEKFEKQLPAVDSLEKFKPCWNKASVVQEFSFPVTGIIERLVANQYKVPATLSPLTEVVLMYRDPLSHRARFFVLNALTASLLSSLTPEKTYAEGFDVLMVSTPALQAMPKEVVIAEALKLLNQCLEKGILLGSVSV